jgi:hypothetical protein
VLAPLPSVRVIPSGYGGASRGPRHQAPRASEWAESAGEGNGKKKGSV